jgi:hypothetical protein
MNFWNSPEQLSAALRWLTWLTALAAFSTTAFGVAIYYVNDQIGALQSSKIEKQGEEINSQKSVVLFQSKIIDEQNYKVIILSNNLKEMQKRADELTLRAQNAERGISDTYDFNGAHRKNMGGGRIDLAVGEETAVFQNMIKLQEEKKWAALREICETQISKTPNWLTPYLFSGIAYANLGDFSKAEIRLQFVVEKAGNDPHYTDASRLLQQVRSALHR